MMWKFPFPAGGARKGGLCYHRLLRYRASVSSVGMRGYEPVGRHMALAPHTALSVGHTTCPQGMHF